MRNLKLPCTIMTSSLPLLRNSATKINRFLAWLLVVMPWLHAVIGTPYWRGFWYDMGLLYLHGLLSLVLFGLPKVTSADKALIWLGIAPARMTPRAEFLFTGFSIAVAVGYLWVFSLVIGVGISIQGVFLEALVMVLGLYLAFLCVLLPFKLIEHVSKSVEYAMARWRVRRSHVRKDVAGVVLLVYFAGHIVNIVVAMGRSIFGWQ